MAAAVRRMASHSFGAVPHSKSNRLQDQFSNSRGNVKGTATLQLSQSDQERTNFTSQVNRTANNDLIGGCCTGEGKGRSRIGGNLHEQIRPNFSGNLL